MVYEIQKLVNAINNEKECMLRCPNGQCISLFIKNDEFFEFIISKDIKNTFLSSSIRRDTLASVSFIGVSFIVSQTVQFACNSLHSKMSIKHNSSHMPVNFLG